MPDQTTNLIKAEQYKLERVYFGKLITETIVLILLCVIPLVVVFDKILLPELFSKSLPQLHDVLAVLTQNQRIGLYILGIGALVLLPFQLKRVWCVQLFPDKLIVKRLLSSPVQIPLHCVESVVYSTFLSIKRYQLNCGDGEFYLPYHLENQDKLIAKLRIAPDVPGVSKINSQPVATTQFKQDQGSRIFSALVVFAHGVFVVALWFFFFNSLASKQVETNDLGLIGLVAGILSFALYRRLELLLKVPFQVTVLPATDETEGGLELKSMVGCKVLPWGNLRSIEDFVFLLPRGINMVTAKGKVPMSDNLNGFDELKQLLKQKVLPETDVSPETKL